MEDQLFQMIEHDIESLLDDSNESVVEGELTKAHVIQSSNSVCQSKCGFESNVFYSYTNAESAANEGLLLGQYVKWSTVESDELNVPNKLVEQRNEVISPLIPSFMTQLVQNFLEMYGQMPTKRACSFCKKNGMHFAIYSSHVLRVNGIQTCPYLLKYRCSNCFQNGHTTSYCPLKKFQTLNYRTTQGAARFSQSNPDQMKRY